MGRPPLTIGTYGRIKVYPAPGGQFQARCKFRDFDGQTRLVSRVGATEPKAEAALKAALVERQRPSKGKLTGDTRIAELADKWYEAPHRWADGTRDTYFYAIGTYVKPALGKVRIVEADTQTIDNVLVTITERHGPGAAKTTRSVLSGMFAHATRFGASRYNPVRDVSPIIQTAKEKPRALTDDQILAIAEAGRSSEWAMAHDLPDFIDWMLATGCRIGEACAARYEVKDGRQLLDLDSRTWEVQATVKRLRGKGLVVQERTKSEAGWRVLALPEFAVDMLQRRQAELRIDGPQGVAFPAPLRRALRDPSNTPGDLRRFFDGLECDHCDEQGYVLGEPDIRCDKGPYSWVTSHVFRKTVATRMDEAGCSPREIADQLGHAHASMTLDVYMGRNVVSATAATVLNR